MGKDNNNEVKESVIRKMTRLAQEFRAVKLSQGFPNEAPPINVRLALANAVLTGNPTTDNHSDEKDGTDANLKSLCHSLSAMPSSSSSAAANGITDTLNQYSPPMGRGDVREAIASYYQRLYQYEVSPDNITVTLGATEALASALRSLGRPSDKVVIFEPFHELYPSQCNLFYLKSSFVTLRPSLDQNVWTFDREELDLALKGASILILNTPHNPTGKIFAHEELRFIVDACLKYKVFIVTDEIYEFMCYSDRNNHLLLPQVFPEVADWCLICNSMGKSASATGWRLGWCVHPSHIRSTYRGIHDQIAVMSPHPVQYASLTYLALPDQYFREELKTRYKGRIDLLASTLNDLGFGVVFPEGAYYLFVTYRSVKALESYGSPMDAAMYLMKEVGVACVPGDNFYGKAVEEEGKRYLRFAACRSEDDITEACARLKKHLTP